MRQLAGSCNRQGEAGKRNLVADHGQRVEGCWGRPTGLEGNCHEAEGLSEESVCLN
jgi:hypothetical protein